ncbi:hypothetical protein GCM10027514_19010 [Azotobacter armeniacus]
MVDPLGDQRELQGLGTGKRSGQQPEKQADSGKKAAQRQSFHIEYLRIAECTQE